MAIISAAALSSVCYHSSHYNRLPGQRLVVIHPSCSVATSKQEKERCLHNARALIIQSSTPVYVNIIDADLDNS